MPPKKAKALPPKPENLSQEQASTTHRTHTWPCVLHARAMRPSYPHPQSLRAE
jgi:hypothetical protein